MSVVSFTETVLVLTVAAATPLLFACLGELIGERAGVLSIGIEGALALGALVGVITSAATGSPYLGLVVGFIVGALLNLIHAFFTISLKANTVISGVMVALLGSSIATFFGEDWVGRDVPTIDEYVIPLVGEYLVQIPILGRAFFQNTPVDYLAILLFHLVWYILFHTQVGLMITAVGDDPQTAETMGLNVRNVRYMAACLAGGMAGLGGATASLAYLQFFTLDLIAGRGWIAIAIVIFAQWHPFRAFAGAYLFGFIDAFKFPAQGVDFSAVLPLGGTIGPVYDFIFNPIIMSTYPFLFTIVILFIIQVRSPEELGMPRGLLDPYFRESV